MILDDIQPRERVAYVPSHAPESPEPGTVSSKNDRFVFVKFDKQLAKFGWDGTTSQSCDPADLVPWHGEAPAPERCPVCGGIEISRRHAAATFLLPETEWKECDHCGAEWGHQ